MSGEKKKRVRRKCPVLNEDVSITLIWIEIDGQRVSEIKLHNCDSAFSCAVTTKTGTRYDYDWSKCPIAQSL